MTAIFRMIIAAALMCYCPCVATAAKPVATDSLAQLGDTTLDLGSIPVDPDRETCPPESLNNMRLLMETRFDSLDADTLANLLEGHASPQTKTLFEQDVIMLRLMLEAVNTEAYLDESNSNQTPSGDEATRSMRTTKSTMLTSNTAVLWATYEYKHRGAANHEKWSLVDFRDRFVKHFGAILCKGLFSKTTPSASPGYDDAGDTLHANPQKSFVRQDCSLPPATASLLAFNAITAADSGMGNGTPGGDGQRVLHHVLEQLSMNGIVVIDSLFATIGARGEDHEETLAAMQLGELLREERLSSSCANAADKGSNICLHPTSEAEGVEVTSSSDGPNDGNTLLLFHGHAGRIEPLIRAIAIAIKIGITSDGRSFNKDAGMRPYDITPTVVVDLSPPTMDCHEGVDENASGRNQCVPVVPTHSTLLAQLVLPANEQTDAAISVEELSVVWFLSGTNAGGKNGSASTFRVQTRSGKSADIVQKPGRMVIFAAELKHEAVLGRATHMQPCLVNRVKIYGPTKE